MTWIRIDDKLTTHPKWLMLSAEARLWWFSAAVWCGAHNNDGVVPEHAFPLICMTADVTTKEMPRIIEQLCRRPQPLPSDEGRPHALMRRVPKARGGGIEFHDWETYQPTKKQVKRRAEVDAAKAEMRALHDWLHKTPPGKKVKAIVELRDGNICCYCDEGPLRTDGDRRGATRRTFDLIDPQTMYSWDWKSIDGDRRPMLSPEEIVRVSDLWCIACGYCNPGKGDRSPTESGFVILPGRGPSADLPRSAAIQSVFGRPVGTDRGGTGQGGSGTGTGTAGSTSASPQEDPTEGER